MSLPSVTRAPRAFSGCRAYASAAQTVTAGVETAVTLDTEEYDTDAYHSGSGSTFTVPVAGWYLVHAKAYMPSTPGVVYGLLKKNGAVIPGSEADERETGVDVSLHVTAVLQLAAGDAIAFFVYRAAGTTIGNATGGASNAFQITRLG